MVDFRDTPEEAAFRSRLRAWLEENNPHLPPSSTSDDYWERQPDWHRALYRGGFFGLTWPQEYGGHGLSSVYDVIVDEELADAGAPPRPSLGYLVQAVLRHANEDVKRRFLPGLISGEDRWCQGFSEPDAGSDLASLRTRAVRDGDEYVITGHKVWTSYSDLADWCFLLARTDPEVPVATDSPPSSSSGQTGGNLKRKHKGLSILAVRMDQPGVEQRPLRMINGITREFGEVIFDGARAPAGDMIGEPGEGWRVAMTVVNHEREPQELGNAARYSKTVRQLVDLARAKGGLDGEQRDALAWAIVEAEMLQHLVGRRLSERLDGVPNGPEGSIDKLLMTEVEQAVGHAALAVGGAAHSAHDGAEASWLSTYLYSRAQSVMGGTAQIQKNLVAARVLGLPTS
jgi:alkylation response protein AidB-like acyl-CoA dehydrogenase